MCSQGDPRVPDTTEICGKRLNKGKGVKQNAVNGNKRCGGEVKALLGLCVDSSSVTCHIRSRKISPGWHIRYRNPASLQPLLCIPHPILLVLPTAYFQNTPSGFPLFLYCLLPVFLPAHNSPLACMNFWPPICLFYLKFMNVPYIPASF